MMRVQCSAGRLQYFRCAFSAASPTWSGWRAVAGYSAGRTAIFRAAALGDSVTDDGLPEAKLPEFPRAQVVHQRGHQVIHTPLINQGFGFGIDERERLGIRGLVPPACMTIEKQARRVMERLHTQFDTPIAKYHYLSTLQDTNETLFYRVLVDNIAELSPIVYTPTIGLAVQRYSWDLRRSRGMYLSAADRGHFHAMLHNWPGNVNLIVVTDGSRVLGLGDLGVNAMGIAIGKLCLYTAAGGHHPSSQLPLVLDMGTNNRSLLSDPYYLGLAQPRVSNAEFLGLADEFMSAVSDRWPHALVHFEDIANPHAQQLLDRYRGRYCVFNDDIQGTGAVAYAALLNALRAIALQEDSTPGAHLVTGDPVQSIAHELGKQRILCVGAGSAGVGVCNQIYRGMLYHGIKEEEARACFWMMDLHGLVSEAHPGLTREQQRFARPVAEHIEGFDLLGMIEHARPTVLIGLSGQAGIFSSDVIEGMLKHTPRPIIFPMSNPTDKSECTSHDAYVYSKGRAIVASGSPFGPTRLSRQDSPYIPPRGITAAPDGSVEYVPTQANNMYIFPGMGLGATLVAGRSITEGMIIEAAHALARCTPTEDLARGIIFPPLKHIRQVSKEVGAQIAAYALRHDIARHRPPRRMEFREFIHRSMYKPVYSPYAAATPPI